MSAVIYRTDQLLERIRGVLERREHVPPPEMPKGSDGTPLKGWA